MPLLYDEDKVLRIAYLRANRLNEKILANPKEYYGKTTKIIYVSPSDSNRNPGDLLNLDDFSEEIGSKNIGDIKTIPSGTSITKGKCDWVFVPYNYDSKSRHRQIKKILKTLNIDVTTFKNSPSHALSQIESNLKEIKQIYKDTKGNGIRGNTSLINENSMFLYSGPLVEPCRHSCFASKINKVDIFSFFRGCIYTGDGDIHIVNLDIVYSKYIQKVGTVQIPHHGSKNSFKESFFNGNNYVCPISAGQNYENFPALTIIKTLIKSCCFPYVTEKTDNFVEGVDYKSVFSFWHNN
jgi:hypothetical protein